MRVITQQCQQPLAKPYFYCGLTRALAKANPLISVLMLVAGIYPVKANATLACSLPLP